MEEVKGIWNPSMKDLNLWVQGLGNWDPMVVVGDRVMDEGPWDKVMG